MLKSFLWLPSTKEGVCGALGLVLNSVSEPLLLRGLDFDDRAEGRGDLVVEDASFIEGAEPLSLHFLEAVDAEVDADEVSGPALVDWRVEVEEELEEDALDDVFSPRLQSFELEEAALEGLDEESLHASGNLLRSNERLELDASEERVEPVELLLSQQVADELLLHLRLGLFEDGIDNDWLLLEEEAARMD